jgi:ring-1,2-phenylacetyl-CoA epoxidase subunit PaaE
MTVFYTLTIATVEYHNNETIEVGFDVPSNLQEQFAFKAGQYITLKTIINNTEVRRSYSLCSSPLHNKWHVAIKKVPNGVFSTYAYNNFKPGIQIEVLPPNGKFYTPLQASNTKHYIAFAAGSGITPIVSIITTTLQEEPNSKFTLVYGNKNSGSIIFKEALEALKNKYVQRFTLVHILSKEYTDAAINYGRIDATKCQHLFDKLLPKKADDYFICGPEQMIFTVKDFLQQQGIDKKHIHFELFGTDKKQTTVATNFVQTSNEAVSNITIIVDGRQLQFTLPYNSTNILDAALQQGADLPYACKGGVCCTCRAKVQQGAVQMAVNYALEEDEVAQGFVLTCQCTPTTKAVVINFDVK